MKSLGDTDGTRISIQRLVDLEAAGIPAATLLEGVARIFRETAATWPANPDDARAFQELWLDQYICHERDLVWLATPADRPQTIVGYLVGCKINPARSSRFATLAYFAVFAEHCAAYPAHLHINVTATHRNRRIGERLVESLCAQLAGDQLPGVHVVTARDQRNVEFYKRLGFVELASTPRSKTEVLFLARRLTK
jgi:GNAT superfamily N-acetyltransferase